MCFNQLGIALDGYGDGAVLLFRGTEMRHYISQWSGNYRYAFDHTTHQSVEDAITAHEKTGRWGPEKDPEAPKASKGGRKSKKPDDEDDEKPDGGDASGKSKGKGKKRERDDDDDDKHDGSPAPKKLKGNTKEPPRDKDEAEAAEDPAPKKRGQTGAKKGARQIQPARGKSKQIKTEQSATQVPVRGSRKGAQNTRQKN